MTKTICELKKGLRVSGRRTAQKLNQMISQKKVNPPNVTPNNSKHDQPDPEVLVNDYILRKKIISELSINQTFGFYNSPQVVPCPVDGDDDNDLEDEEKA